MNDIDRKFDPIWDLEFQFSFLTISSLIITVQSINQRLQWLPTAIASLIAVPVAATIWTLPIQLSVFGVVPTYSIVLNILSTPFITIVSIGGMVSAVVALIFPPAGSAVAGMLNYPTTWLISLVELVGNLPGNSLTVGKIAIWQLLTVYTLILLVWWVKWWKKRWWFAGLKAVNCRVPAQLARVSFLFCAFQLANMFAVRHSTRFVYGEQHHQLRREILQRVP